MNGRLMLGIAREIITPKVGCALYGYAPDVISVEVNDDLTATAFYFVYGETKSLMISATVCSFSKELVETILPMISEASGVPKDHIILAATHTHSGPNLKGSVGWGDIDREYCDSIFIPQVVKAAKRASECPVPVKVGMAQGGSCIGINRRELRPDNRVVLGQNPWGCFNPTMTVISFADDSGKVIANIIHYGAHGTASGRNHEISRDWAGVMTDEVEAISGGITAFFNGPEGDVGPRMMNGRTTGAQNVKYAMVHGAWAAQDAVRIYKQIRSFGDADMSAVTSTVEIPLAGRVSKEEAEAMYEKFSDQTVNIGAAQRRYYKAVLDSYETDYTDSESLSIDQTLIRIGSTAFAAFPYELFSEIGMRIDQASSVPYVLSLSNANGSYGYFVTQDQICRGGYEVTSFKMMSINPYRDDADFALVTGTLENLKKL